MAEKFANGIKYCNTLGGNAVLCAIAMAVFDVIERERLPPNAQEVGSYLIAGGGG